mmetsp:Transcript_2041/g.5362  ORF Transcript_2041/g.5362 Transcript_2041/m.5362 type:complete len:268 (-) Transcript_2041:445-1248(-)
MPTFTRHSVRASTGVGALNGCRGPQLLWRRKVGAAGDVHDHLNAREFVQLEVLQQPLQLCRGVGACAHDGTEPPHLELLHAVLVNVRASDKSEARALPVYRHLAQRRREDHATEWGGLAVAICYYALRLWRQIYHHKVLHGMCSRSEIAPLERSDLHFDAVRRRLRRRHVRSCQLRGAELSPGPGRRQGRSGRPRAAPQRRRVQRARLLMLPWRGMARPLVVAMLSMGHEWIMVVEQSERSIAAPAAARTAAASAEAAVDAGAGAGG